MIHSELVRQAKIAIDKVFDDTSVDLETALASLEELQEQVEMNIQAVQDDIIEEE